ncbi:dTDP-4-dehydrorhamnose 3,5-epimerase family protein [Fodinicurvata sediminis]|uniref:dTDP-4-dehydrorhamnose 3,5-epimerase family protein n=1 Tax=Fodinicurvata sediminis TaxID=1121832 RepID=UPI0003B3DC7F|nr:dTDP-4-dehydrorhamnose 3,5-epimerase [Fodinicurvata sediminis]
MNRFEIEALPLAGLACVVRQTRGDARGYFSRLFCSEDLFEAGWETGLAQVNHSYTQNSGTVRGFHFQNPPFAEMKLVHCLQGEVWDVAVDIRHDSPTFLQWHGERLSSANGRGMLIPEGFAHGFQALSDDVELLYFHSVAHAPAVEEGLNPLDPKLGISWPLPISVLSKRDRGHPYVQDNFKGI